MMSDEPIIFARPLWWRDTHKQVRFVIFDGRLVLVLFFALMHLRVWTVLLAVASILVVTLFERKGVGADDILRYLRASLAGRRRTARGVEEERPPVDFGFETPQILARDAARIEGLLVARQKTEAARKAKAQAARTPRGWA